jgi:hypothetical protein
MVNLMLAELRSRMNAAQERLRAALCSEDPADYQAALVEFESSNEAYMNALTETFIAPRAEKVAGPDKSPDV